MLCKMYHLLEGEKVDDANGTEYTERSIKEQSPTVEELKAWHQRSGLPLKKFFDTGRKIKK